MADTRPAPSLADIWIHIADTGCRDYSPIYDRICRTVAGSDAVLELVQQAPPKGHFPNVLLGAVHYLLLGGLDHPLAAVYSGESDADPGPLFVDVCLTHRDEILELLATRHTNTNEVGRSAALGLALTAVADRLGAPLGLVDVGASAGLNLFCDRYRLDYGVAGATGPADAAVHVACEVVGGRPRVAPALPNLAARTGLDLDPVDVRDDDAVRWLLACVWPDTGRLPRTRRALDEARKDPPYIVAGDAVDGVADVVLGLPVGVTPVVTTTWMLAYLPRARRVAFREALTSASRERPIAWVSAEGAGVVDRFEGVEAPSDAQGMESSVFGLLTLRDGALDTTELLGFVHPHGNWVDWRA
jgi:hypothetical protein